MLNWKPLLSMTPSYFEKFTTWFGTKEDLANTELSTIFLIRLTTQTMSVVKSKSLCSVQYISFDKAVQMGQTFGPGALLFKINIKSVFWLLPVDPKNFDQLGFKIFDYRYFFDKCLPFGCSISCSIFQSFACFREFFCSERGILWSFATLFGWLFWWPQRLMNPFIFWMFFWVSLLPRRKLKDLFYVFLDCR